MKRVLVEVRGGTAEVVHAPRGVAMEVIDLDVLREGDPEDIRRYWNDDLSPAARTHVKKTYPRTLEFLTAERAL